MRDGVCSILCLQAPGKGLRRSTRSTANKGGRGKTLMGGSSSSSSAQVGASRQGDKVMAGYECNIGVSMMYS